MAKQNYSEEYEEECDHEFTEAVDDNGKLIEPAYDICIHCGCRKD